jgi:nucleotide-binding universal stress UspA family protein
MTTSQAETPHEASHTILVPLDFEAPSDKALALAKELAPKLGAKVSLLHIYSTPVYTYPGLDPTLAPSLYAEISEAARKAIEARAEAEGGLPWELREGDPAAEILAAIDKTHPQLVIMGTHGRRGFAHAFLGSVAEKVVRKSEAPVMTVHA